MVRRRAIGLVVSSPAQFPPRKGAEIPQGYPRLGEDAPMAGEDDEEDEDEDMGEGDQPGEDSGR